MRPFKNGPICLNVAHLVKTFLLCSHGKVLLIRFYSGLVVANLLHNCIEVSFNPSYLGIKSQREIIQIDRGI